MEGEHELAYRLIFGMENKLPTEACAWRIGFEVLPPEIPLPVALLLR
jgi:hypothetical protein